MANHKEFKYTKSHEWVEFITDTKVAIGLTDYAQHQLGDIVFVNLPQEGDSFGLGETVCDVESVKAVSDVFSPIAGTVCAINEEVMDSPSKINEAPYDAWLFQLDNIGESEELMNFEEYVEFSEKEV